MRKPLIAGNWKMNMTPYEAQQLIQGIQEWELDSEVEALVCVPFIDIPTAQELLESGEIKLGAQNFYHEDSGAFTGEISGPMLKDYGVEYIIIGHSERRNIFKEDDELINKKVISALKQGFKPILCVGESLKEREAGKAEEKVKNQIKEDLKGLKPEDLKDIVVAYEPIWAIGTGKTASADDAEKMCAYIRKLVHEIFGHGAAAQVRIQYGGSVKPANIREIMAKENIDGALVGGASLDAKSFVSLVNNSRL